MMDDEKFDDLDELPALPRSEMLASDCELLELAARALGAVRFEVVEGENWANLHFEDGSTIFSWNPLVHGDDALELAVKLMISIDPRKTAVCVVACEGKHVVMESHIGAEAMPATRRAVTRVAAEIGKVRNS